MITTCEKKSSSFGRTVKTDHIIEARIGGCMLSVQAFDVFGLSVLDRPSKTDGVVLCLVKLSASLSTCASASRSFG